MRSYTPIDQVIIQFADCLSLVFKGNARTHACRPNPSDTQPEVALAPHETETVIGMMRVNHAGEVCAQALYQGQAVFARQPAIKAHLRQAASEEVDHLVWCADRIQTLGGKISYLTPLWYVGAFFIGMLAGICGDKHSLGFIAETENQVSEHLHGHLQKLPVADLKSRAILTQMQADEQNHAQDALAQGGADLPFGIPSVMRLSAKIMTRLAFFI